MSMTLVRQSIWVEIFMENKWFVEILLRRMPRARSSGGRAGYCQVCWLEAQGRSASFPRSGEGNTNPFWVSGRWRVSILCAPLWPLSGRGGGWKSRAGQLEETRVGANGALHLCPWFCRAWRRAKWKYCDRVTTEGPEIALGGEGWVRLWSNSALNDFDWGCPCPWCWSKCLNRLRRLTSWTRACLALLVCTLAQNGPSPKQVPEWSLQTV